MHGRRPSGAYSESFADEPAAARERAAAAGVATILATGLGFAAAYAREPAAVAPAVTASIETLAIAATLLCASMLYAQYRIKHHLSLGVLACGFAVLGLLQTLYLATLPGEFAPGGLLGAGPQTPAWLYAAARLGFCAGIFAYVSFERSGKRSARWKSGMFARMGAACAAFVLVTIVLTIAGHALLPKIVLENGTFAPWYRSSLGPLLFCAYLAAIARLVAASGTSRRLHLWLGVVLFAFALEVLAGVLGGGTSTRGWEVAAVYFAVGSIAFCIVLQSLSTSMLARAARSGERAHALAEIVSLGSDAGSDRNLTMLERAARDLQFDWAHLAQLGDDGWIVLESSLGDPRYPVGYRAPIAGGWVRESLHRGGPTIYEKGDELPWLDDRPGGLRGWSSFVTVPVFVEERLYGFAGFARRAPRDAPLNEADLAFLELVGALAGATIGRQRQRRRLDQLAFLDGLTGLPNRVLLFDRLRHTLASAARHERPFAVHFLDLDGFKEVNDSFGHAAGDEVLREVGRRLAGAVRESDTVARLGGDEFVVLQSEIERPKDADRLAARLRAIFETPIVFGETQLSIGTSIGTSHYPRDGREAQALLSRADEALYRAKERRRKAGAPSDVTFIERAY